MRLENQVIAITGAFGVLGRAMVQAGLKAGARVAALDRAPLPVDFQSGPDLLALGDIDITEDRATTAAFQQIARHFGGLDGLVNIAGGFRWQTLADGDPAAWDALYEMNLKTAVTASRAALAHLLERKGGRIVNVGALGALKAGAGMGPYAASKAGVMRFTESLAEEVKDRGITVNAVLPSIIDTPTNRKDMPKAEFDRWVKPEALAQVIVFLLSPEAAPVNGALIAVPGRV
jgi:NAD(P)-dependent dehydrogenase (short-subunit alcohol dehydrogenase family)